MVALSVLLASGLTLTPGRAADEPTPAEMRKAVGKALPYLAEGGEAWMSARNCNSCHRVTFMLWGYEEADRRGIEVERPKLDVWTKWALADSLKPQLWYTLRSKAVARIKADGVPDDVLTKAGTAAPPTRNFTTRDEFVALMEKTLTADEWTRHGDTILKHALGPKNGGGPDTLAQLLLAVTRAGTNPDTRKQYTEIKDLLVEWQEIDGYWIGGGQLPAQRRPRAELNEVTTMWAVLALAAYGTDDLAAVAARDRALKWLKAGKPGVSTETLLLRAAIEHRFGEAEKAKELLALALNEQRPDGGWAWLRAGKVSDALTTGQALYMLGLLGKDGSDPVVRKASAFLASTQEADGSWAVPAAEITTGNEKRLEKVEEPYRYWGTAWAVIGLAHTLPAR
jgi:hypothetical protein